ncbi:putative odorant receptor 83c [Toxorhynchites rutilus septentrionalis]|uniref:putative odorant receptor 83c n=1 Tax=Toxorhynchites rutilus septentrionalis TaxID=329112 RepID=UPI00247968FF|nr:putative odorant receptor 83c [Toxorhynchites rutilus septentrionalis]
MNLRNILKRRFRILDQQALDQERSIDVFNDVIAFLRNYLFVVGMDVLDEDYHWNMRTTICALSLATYFTFMIHTLYLNWGQWILVLESCTITGIGFQGIVKMHDGLKHFEFFNNLYRGLKAMHERNATHKENNRVLVFSTLLIHYIFRAFLLIYFFAGIGLALFPMFMYIRHNELVMVMRVQIPGIDPTNEIEFIITTIYHVILLGLGIAGILAADLAIMVLVLHIVGIVDVFRNSLKELDQLLEDEERDEDMIHRKLLDICVMHKELIAYEEGLDSTYGVAVFVQVLTSVSCLALSLFIYYVTGNFGIGLFIIGAFFQLLEFCMLGTALTIKNEHIEQALYDIRWYKLSKRDQKTLGFVLFRSQNAVEMTIGGLALLNMETFVEVGFLM